MDMFDSVVIAYDPPTFDLAMPMRSMLELYRLYVHMYYCCQKRNVLDVLAGEIPDAQYVILVAGGCDKEELDRGGRISFRRLVEQIDGKWQPSEVRLFPEDVSSIVRLDGRTVIAIGCYTGREPLARAFLDAGCKAYIGSAEAIDQNSTTMFVCAFFHYLLAESPDRLDDREAVERARQIDSQTANYRWYSKEPGGDVVCL